MPGLPVWQLPVSGRRRILDLERSLHGYEAPALCRTELGMQLREVRRQAQHNEDQQ